MTTSSSLPALPALPLKNIVVFPQIVQHLAVGRRKSMAALKRSSENAIELVTVAQQAPDVEDPELSDLHPIGTLVQIKRIESHDQGAQVIVQGERRVRILSAVPDDDCLMLEVEPLPDFSAEGPVEREAVRSIRRKVAHKMVTSMTLVPHVSHLDEADVTVTYRVICCYSSHRNIFSTISISAEENIFIACVADSVAVCIRLVLVSS